MPKSKHLVRSFDVLGLGIALLVAACAGQPRPEAASAAAGSLEAVGAPALAARAAAGSAELGSHLGDLMPTGLTTLGATTLGGSVYVLGGYSGPPHNYSKRDQSADFARYDLAARRWEKLPSIGPIQSAVLVNDGRHVYRVGGMRALNEAGQPENMHSLGDVARFDPATGAWQALDSLPVPRSSHQALVVGTTLYVIGGWKLAGASYDSEYQQTLLSCDLSQPKCAWQSRPMPFATRAMGAAEYNGKLYVLGGLTPDGGSDAVHVYDIASETWTAGPALPKDNLTICAAVYGERLYANGADGTVYRLSPDGQSWEPGAKLQFPRMFHQLVSSSAGLVVLGGIPSRDRGSRVRHMELVSPEAAPAGVKWTIASVSAAKNRQGAFLLGQQLYVFGGNNSLEQHDFERDNFVDTAHRLDLGALEWRPLESFPAKRQSMQTLITGDAEKPQAWVVGGFGFQGERLSSQPDVYRYDFAGDKWAKQPAGMSQARSQFGLVEWEGAAWVFGGLNFDATRKEEFQLSPAVLRLDVAHPESGFVPAGLELREVRRAFAGARLGDRYYMTGGLADEFKSVTSCEVVDLKAKASLAMKCPKEHRLGGDLVALGGKLYLIGGSVQNAAGQREPTPRIEVYDPAADAWSTLSDVLPFPVPRQLQTFAFHDQLLLYTANHAAATVEVALLDPKALAAGRRNFVEIAVPPAPPPTDAK